MLKLSHHILVIPSWYPPNGGSFFKEQSEELKSRGHKVGVVYVETNSFRHFSIKSFTNKYFQTKVCEENGVLVLRVFGWAIPKFEWLQYKLWTWLMIKSIEKYVVKFGKPDLMHVHSSIWGGLVAAKIKKKYQIPYVITEHRGRFGFITNMARSQFKGWYKYPLKEALQNTDKLIPVSKRLINKIQSFSVEKKIPTIVIPNVVDINFFFPDQTIKHYKDFTFLIVAGLTPVKGVDFLIPAFNNLLQYYPNAKLRVGGAGAQSKSLEQMVVNFNIQESVIFLGNLTRNQVKMEMNASHFFVLSSLMEAQPVVTCEAMAMGLPVLTTTVVSNDVVTKETGIQVKPESIEALEQGLIKAIKTRSQFDSAKIREFAIQNFSYDVIFNQIESVYDKVLKEYES